MRNVCLAALVLATLFLVGCIPPARGGIRNDGGPLPLSVVIGATLMAIHGYPDPRDPLCDPDSSDPSPPATCPPIRDEKAR